MTLSLKRFCFVLSFIVAAGTFIESSNAIEKSSISLSQLPCHKSRPISKFEHVFYEGKSDDTLYYVANAKGIGTVTYKKVTTGTPYDVVEYNGKTFQLFRLDDDDTVRVDADPSTAQLFQIKIGHNRYYYFYCSGTGLLRSGSFQQISFYTIFSKTLNPVTMISGLEYPNSFCDINNNGKLGFIQFIASDDTIFDYRIKTFELEKNKFKPVECFYNDKYMKDTTVK
jgi:hypothetical protein